MMNDKDKRNLVGAGLRPAPAADGRYSGPQRKPLRFPGYDYSYPGAYFVTVCTQNRKCLFGRIVNGAMQLNDLGAIVDACWRGLTQHYSHIDLDSFVVMPNHIHGIIILAEQRVPVRSNEVRSALPEIVRAFKSFSAREINHLRGTSRVAIWQRGYYEHIIRKEDSLNRIREYIETNPLRWHLDRENPEFVPADGGAGLRPAPTKDDPFLR